MEHQSTQKKLVTLGLTTCNRAQFLPQTIECFLSQTYPHFELVICDDASRDDTKAVCVAYAKKDSRIRYVRNEKNQGYIKNLGFLVAHAAGDYFLWAHDDDWWDRTFLEKLVAALDTHEEYDVAMCDFRDHHSVIYDPNEKAKQWTHRYTDKSHYYVYRQMLRAPMNPIFAMGLFRTDYIKRLMRRSFPKAKEDTWIWLGEIALSTKLYSVPEVLTSKYRQPVIQRVRHGFVGDYYAEPFPFAKNALVTLTWLMSSPNIPIWRKPLIIIPWLELCWKCKRKITREITHWIGFT